MNLRWALVAGLSVGLAVALGTTGPAFASEPALSTIRMIEASPVEGEAWSYPAFPVTCVQATSQISCTPTDPALVKPQMCLLGVLVAGARAAVCSTYEGHIDAIKASGGKPITVAYGCTLADLVCATFENAGRGMALIATASMFLVADNMRFDTSTLLWSAATEEWSFWQWAILAILFTSMVWAIGAAVISRDREQLVGAIVRSFIAIPAVPITLWLTGHLLNSIDDLTWYLLGRGGVGELWVTMQSVMWAGGQANYFFAFLIHGLLMISMFLLTLVFAFRNIVLAALIAVGPIAWMLFPVRGVGPQWVVRYVSAVVVLLLTGPLTLGFVTLIVNGMASVKTIWDPQSWPLLMGLVLVAFAPFAIFGLFSFVGAVAADGAGSRLGSGAGRIASSSARSASRLPTRLGATPAGVAPASIRARASQRPPDAPSGTPSGPATPSGRRASQTTPNTPSAPPQSSSPARTERTTP